MKRSLPGELPDVVIAGGIPSRANIMCKRTELRNSLMLLEQKLWNVRLEM